jgi:outer membrane protein OmpA-like peptidoglycan-associated protein
LAIVAHDGLKTNETIDAAQARTKARAEAIKLTLGEMGADTRKLVAVGAGPIAPIDRSNRRRVELVFLR